MPARRARSEVGTDVVPLEELFGRPGALHANCREANLYLFEVVIGQKDLKRVEVLCQMSELGRSWIGTIHGRRASSQARATCPGVASLRRPTR